MWSATDHERGALRALPAIPQQVEDLNGEVAGHMLIHDVGIRFGRIPLDTGQPVHDAVGAHVAQQGGDTEPEPPELADNKESVVAQGLVERHQDPSVFGCRILAETIDRQRLAEGDLLKRGVARSHAEPGAWLDSVPVTNFNNSGEPACHLGEEQSGPLDLRQPVGPLENVGGFQGYPGGSLDVIRGGWGIVLPALEPHCDVPQIVEVLEHGEVEVFFQPEDDRDRKVQGKSSVPQRVADRPERRALAGRRVEIDDVYATPCLPHFPLDLIQKVKKLPVFYGTRCGSRIIPQLRDPRRRPVPVEVTVDIPFPGNESGEITAKAGEPAPERWLQIFEVPENALQPLERGRLVAME